MLEQPASCGLPAGQLLKLRKLGEWPGVFPQGLRARDWAVQLSWSLTSWSTLSAGLE